MLIMKRALLYIASATILLGGCAKVAEQNTDEKDGKVYRISAVVENNETRTFVTYDSDAKKYYYDWNIGEQIGVIPDGYNVLLPFEFEDANTDTFAYTAPANSPDYTSFGLAVSPKNAIIEGSEVDNFSLVLSGEYVQGESNAVMVAGAPTDVDGKYKFSFKHAGALVRVIYKSIPAETAAMVLSTPDHPIQGDWAFFDNPTTPYEMVAEGASAIDGGNNIATVTYDPDASLNDFYVPIPTGQYTTFTVKLVKEGGAVIPGSEKTFATTAFTVARSIVVKLPEIEIEDVTITKGASYTLEQKSGQAFTSFTGTGSQLAVNSMTWSIAKVSGAENATIQSNISSRGLQVGSSNNGVKIVTVTGSDYDVYAKAQGGGDDAYGIKDIEIMVCAAEGNEVTVGVTVGGTAMSSSDATHTITGVTIDAVETSHFTSDELLSGDIVITYTLKNQAALYINDILINPAPTLANPVVSATSEVSSVTVSWEAITGAETYDVLLDGDTDYSQEGVTGTSYTFDSIADGTYTVSVTAKATGYDSGVGTTTVKVKKDGPDKYILVEEAGAFVDGGKYVLALRDGTADGHAYFFISGMTSDTNTEKDALTITDGKILGPDEKYIFTATASNGGFTLKGSDNKYVYNSGGNTNVNSNASAFVWVPTFLTASKAYKLVASSSGRFLSSGNSSANLKAYASSNTFKDQIAEGVAIGQYYGAISVFKLGGISVDPAIIDATVDNLSARAGSHEFMVTTKGTESKVKIVSKQGNIFASDPTVKEDGYTLEISLKDNYASEVQQGTITVALVDNESVTGTITVKQKAAEFRVSSDAITLAGISGSTAQFRVYSDFDWEIVNANTGYTVTPSSYVYDGSSYKILTVTAAADNSQASSVNLGSFTVKRVDNATLTVAVSQESAVVPNPSTVDVINGNATFSATWTPAEHATGYVAYLHTSQTDTPATGGQALTPATVNGKYTVSAENLTNGATYYLYVKVSSVDDGYLAPTAFSDAFEVAPVASNPVPNDETITFSNLYSENTKLNGVTINGDNFTIQFNNGGGTAPQYYSNGTSVRAYANNTFTVEAKDSHKIASIVLSFGSGDGSNPITTDSGTYSNGTWTGSEGTVVFTVGGSSGNRRIAAVTVSYAE